MNQDQTDHTSRGKQASAWTALIVDIINTSEVRQILTEAGAAWLRDWSGGNLLKKGAGRPAAWALTKTLRGARQSDLPSVFEKPEHIEALCRVTPEILGHLTAIAQSIARAVEQLTAERKKALFNQLISGHDAGLADGLLGVLSRILADIYTDDPCFFSRQLSPLIENWVANTDFGELKSIFDTTKIDLENMLKQASDVLFEYPAKLIALLSLVPDGINLLVFLARAVLENLTILPPDILTDLLLTLIKRVDATAIGQSLNHINEAIRQCHTGSTLIGEMDAPRFTADLREKVSTIMDQIDPALAVKAGSALIDGRETLASALIEATQAHPDFLILWLRQLALKPNSKFRMLKQKLQALEMLPEDDADKALAAGLAELNAYDLAEIVNALSRSVNRVNRVKPDLFPTLVSSFISSLDLYELEESMAWMSRDLGKSIRPLFRVVAPSIIQELCNLFEPGDEDDGYDDAMLQARQRLQNLFLGQEVAP